MKTWKIIAAAAIGAALAANAWAQQTTLRIFTGGQQRQFVIRCLQQRPRKHAEKFRRHIHRQIESFTRERLLALFTAIFPAGPTVLDFEMFFDRRLHVIVAVAVVFDRHAGIIELPSSSDVVAATAIVIRIFSAHRAVRLNLDALRPSRITLNQDFVSAILRR